MSTEFAFKGGTAFVDEMEAAEQDFSQFRQRVDHSQSRAIAAWAKSTSSASIPDNINGFHPGLGQCRFNLVSENRAAQIRNALDPFTGDKGGFLIGEDFGEQLEFYLQSFDSIRRLSTVLRREKSGDYSIPTIDDVDQEGAVIELNATLKTTDEPSYGQLILPATDLGSKGIFLSNSMLRDGQLFSSSLAKFIGERIGRLQNRLMTNHHAYGLTVNASVGTTTANATSIQVDEVLDLVGSVDEAYASNGTLMMHRDIHTTLLKLKDSNSNYLWQTSGLSKLPVVNNRDMPSAATANARTILFGDFSHHIIRDVGDLRVLKDSESKAEKDQILFYGVLTSGSGLLDSSAIKCLQQAA